MAESDAPVEQATAAPGEKRNVSIPSPWTGDERMIPTVPATRCQAVVQVPGGGGLWGMCEADAVQAGLCAKHAEVNQ